MLHLAVESLEFGWPPVLIVFSRTVAVSCVNGCRCCEAESYVLTGAVVLLIINKK